MLACASQLGRRLRRVIVRLHSSDSSSAESDDSLCKQDNLWHFLIMWRVTRSDIWNFDFRHFSTILKLIRDQIVVTVGKN